MKFDDIIVLLKDFGKYQKILYFLVCIPAFFGGMQSLSPVFVLFIPSHRCKVPGLGNDTYSVQDNSHEITINQSIPLVLDDDGYKYSTCDVYMPGNSTIYDGYSVPVNTSTTSCDEWVYDKSEFQSTFITYTNLICGQTFVRANANMILMAGKLFGSLAFGVLADIFGRKTAMMLAAFLHVVGAFGSAFAPNYALFVTFRFIVGMSTVGMFISMFVIGMEFVGPSKRVFVGIVIEIVWCIGLYLLCFLAYFLRDWDRLQLAMACPTVLLFLYYWLIPESPRWLISRERFEEADKIIHKCAKVNGITLPENVVSKDSSNDDTNKQSILKMLTVPRLLCRTLIIYFNWCVVSMVYYGLSLNVGNLDGDIYVGFAINTSMEFAAYVLCMMLLNKMGRKALFAITMILGGVACLSTIFTVLYVGKSFYWITVVLANIGKFGVSAAYAVIIVWSAELFPTVVRNSGMGSSSMFARIGGMTCPYIADLGTIVEGSFGKALPLIIFGGLSVAAGLLSLLLPETNGKVLPENITDAENFGKENQQEQVDWQ